MKRLTPKKLVLKFHENKNFLLYYLTGIELLDVRDFENIKEISAADCRKFLWDLDECKTDSDFCIFCSMYIDEHGGCPKCPYRKNHGYCMGYGTPYNRIREKISWVQIRFSLLMEDLIEETYQKYLKIKKI